MQSESGSDPGELRIRVNGRFDFEGHRAFRDAYEQADGVRRFVVDLSATDYVDSAGLGMLLLLREHARHHGAAVAIAGANSAVERILRIACFHELFEMSRA
ncbi:anti-anti-sigma factor [Spiribacter halobius]|uniref:Anti-anti-sigma factor n=1 Tax=Sediminicurvatus halobius TaxID=2182432 RepID=A0A2U2N4X9_9GAMM|nr:STAS domain-containing protein [Spiribacter halobius]PWG64153.1 anti-anti-sigma factor [Spiribacter halobius]UEX79964.1 STAS domain-containing protein [Spiribacter halobius]